MTPARAVSWLVRAGLAALFVYAGVLKVWNPATFQHDIEGYCLIPPWAAAAGSLYLPWVEILAGLGLLVGSWRSGASLVLCVLMLVFVAALTSAAVRGIDLSCGCFGPATATTSYPWAFSRDLGILALLAGQWLMSRRPGTRLPPATST